MARQLGLPTSFVHRIAQFVWMLCNPFVSLEYFRRYRDIVRQIAEPKSKSNYLASLALTTVNLTLALKTVHFCYLSLGGASGSACDLEAHMVLHFDQLSMLLGLPGFNALVPLSSLMIIYLNQRLFRTADLILLRMLSQVMLERRWPSRIDLKSFDQSKVKTTNRNQSEVRFVRRSFLWSARFLLSMVLVILALFAYTWVTFTVRSVRLFQPNHQDELTYSMSSPSSSFITFFLTASQLSALGHLLYQLNLTHALALNFALTGALLSIFYVRMRHLHHWTCQRSGGYFNLTHYSGRYRTAYLRTIGFFLRCNHSHGRLFAAFLASVCPANVGITAWLLQPHHSPEQSNRTVVQNLVLYVWIANLMYVSFVLHLVFARCTRLIHRPPARQWCPLAADVAARANANASKRSANDFRSIHRLAMDIQAWHVSRQYGFTYGVFGLVTLATFVRFVLLYVRFILIGYKLLRITEDEMIQR